jgi:hypothetical protein
MTQLEEATPTLLERVAEQIESLKKHSAHITPEKAQIAEEYLNHVEEFKWKLEELARMIDGYDIEVTIPWQGQDQKLNGEDAVEDAYELSYELISWLPSSMQC